MSTPIYKIRTVRDFLLVPPNRRTAMLAEFGMWIEAAQELLALLDNPEANLVFAWYDDGEEGLREIKISCGDVEVLVMRRPAP